ncbi:hypothetical protein VPH35_054824 [Triticum aestivum]|uniref:Uncharacterized protein n=1 Tax=Triticum turgidum subsp. durum TaxID=4567 RepID=A0A9R1QU74_TRITD|nr:unnamed protein product [Triticum turgidum subsp. durum]
MAATSCTPSVRLVLTGEHTKNGVSYPQLHILNRSTISAPSDGSRDVAPSDGSRDAAPSDGPRDAAPSDGPRDAAQTGAPGGSNKKPVKEPKKKKRHDPMVEVMA